MKQRNKKYKSNKSIILLSAVFAVLLCAAVLITYFLFSDSARTTADGTPDESLPLAGSYKPYKAVESETGREQTLGAVFGSSYGQYGGELTLSGDGAFTVYVGASNNDDAAGTYTVENNRLNAVYNSGRTAVFTVEADPSGEISIIVPMGLYNIYFH